MLNKKGFKAVLLVTFFTLIWIFFTQSLTIQTSLPLLSLIYKKFPDFFSSLTSLISQFNLVQYKTLAPLFTYSFLLILSILSLIPGIVFSLLILKFLKYRVSFLKITLASLLIIYAVSGFMALLVNNFERKEALYPFQNKMVTGQIFFPSNNLQRIRCVLFPPQATFEWTVPVNNSTDVQLRTPVVASLKLSPQSRMTEGAILMKGDIMENVGQTLGTYGGSNQVMVPTMGSGDVAELQALEKVDQASSYKIFRFLSPIS